MERTGRGQLMVDLNLDLRDEQHFVGERGQDSGGQWVLDPFKGSQHKGGGQGVEEQGWIRVGATKEMIIDGLVSMSVCKNHSVEHEQGSHAEEGGWEKIQWTWWSSLSRHLADTTSLLLRSRI